MAAKIKVVLEITDELAGTYDDFDKKTYEPLSREEFEDMMHDVSAGISYKIVKFEIMHDENKPYERISPDDNNMTQE